MQPLFKKEQITVENLVDLNSSCGGLAVGVVNANCGGLYDGVPCAASYQPLSLR